MSRPLLRSRLTLTSCSAILFALLASLSLSTPAAHAQSDSGEEDLSVDPAISGLAEQLSEMQEGSYGGPSFEGLEFQVTSRLLLAGS